VTVGGHLLQQLLLLPLLPPLLLQVWCLLGAGVQLSHE
jgi:hypothetical protein